MQVLLKTQEQIHYNLIKCTLSMHLHPLNCYFPVPISEPNANNSPRPKKHQEGSCEELLCGELSLRAFLVLLITQESSVGCYIFSP